jgi:hypothetical protein
VTGHRIVIDDTKGYAILGVFYVGRPKKPTQGLMRGFVRGLRAV